MQKAHQSIVGSACASYVTRALPSIYFMLFQLSAAYENVEPAKLTSKVASNLIESKRYYSLHFPIGVGVGVGSRLTQERR